MSKTAVVIKVIHSLLFFLIGICTLYVLYAAIVDRITPITWGAFGVAISELLVLVFNDWICPLTTFAERRGAESGSVADLFLPAWLSDRLFPIFSILFGITCLLLFWRVLGG